MWRRILLAVLVPTLVGTMVWAGVATARYGLAPDVVAVAGQEEPPEPNAPPVPEEQASAGYVGDPNRLIVPQPAPTATAESVVEEVAPPPPPPPAYDVAGVQRRLEELRYYVGPIDGTEGPAMRSAVMAFQKVNSLTPDGAIGQSTLDALAAPTAPVLREGPADRIEIDLNIQVLHLILGGELARTMPVSSGNGATYTTDGGGRARSLTPAGHFTIERRIRGVRKAPLGTLYDPMYFYRGWAIHGSNSVPAYPASHGCVRVTRPDALWLFDRAPNGMSVSLYGGQHTFPAGSAAPGTDTPAGDVAPQPAPAPAPAPTPETATETAPEPAPEPAGPSPTPDPGSSEQPEAAPEPEPEPLAPPVLPSEPAPETDPAPPDDTSPPDPA